MTAPQIRFSDLRLHRSSQNDAFEELTRQLVIADPPADTVRMENRGAGADGGVEILARLSDGKIVGWQCKWFPSTFRNGEVQQLKKSFKTAIKNYKKLCRYIVAIPKNLSGSSEGRQKTETKFWSDFVDWAETEAKNAGLTVEMELWDETEFIRQLSRTDARFQGILHYWFSKEVFSHDWFMDIAHKSFSRIGDRYSPDDHVDVSIQAYLGALRRDSSILESIEASFVHLRHAKQECERASRDPENPVKSAAFKLSEQLDDVLELVDDVDLDAPGPFEFALIRDRLSKTVKSNEAEELLEALYRRKSVDKDEFALGSILRHTIEDILSGLREARSGLLRPHLELLAHPKLLLHGEAGSGKSHLLANQVDKHLADGHAAIFIPAVVIDPKSPEKNILEYCDLPGLQFKTFLATLQAYALASGRPALIAIDAINESDHAERWKSSLPALITQFDAFSEVSLVISYRSSFHDYCVPSTMRDITKARHYGFLENAGEAARLYLDRHGIERPSAPIFGLSREFTNPLFLSTCVKALQSQGETSFPHDLDNLPRLLSYWLASIESNLIQSGFDRIAANDGKLQRIVEKIGEAMALRESEYIPWKDAYEICENVINLGAPQSRRQEVLTRLIEEGVFLDWPNKDYTDKRINFSFQKFSDYFIAEAHIALHSDRKDLAKSLRKGGDLSYIFDHTDNRYGQSAGLRIALLALVPIKFKCELPFLDEGFLDDVSISIDDFVESIPWRATNGVNHETVDLLERQLASSRKGGLDQESFYDLLLQLATLPGCALNADYLFEKLVVLSMPDRDADWSVYLIGQVESLELSDRPYAAYQLIDWAWNSPSYSLDIERVELAATALSLMFTTNDRQVRDRATKALSSLFMKYPAVIAMTIDRFGEFNDPYVRERVFSAALSASLYESRTDLLVPICRSSYKAVFASEPVQRSAYVRRLAHLIIKHGVANGVVLEDNEIKRSSPPYRSKPITDWPTYDDVRAIKDNAPAIVRSALGYFSDNPEKEASPSMAGDFGNYTLGGISSSFSSDARGDLPIQTPRMQKESFWQEVLQYGDSFAESIENLKELYAYLVDVRLKNMRLVEFDLDEDGGIIIGNNDPIPEELSKAEKEFEEAEEIFLNLLPDEKVALYKDISPLEVDFSDDRIKYFSQRKAQCWIVMRALELGWKADIHGELEQHRMRISWDRYTHTVERIGKKYQWIAYWELLGYLADYHWYQNWSEPPAILEAIEDFEPFDIDPSVLIQSDKEGIPDIEVELPAEPDLNYAPGSIASNMKWTKTTKDIPRVPDFIVGGASGKALWWVCEGIYRSDDYFHHFRSQEPFRSAQILVELLIVGSGDEQALWENIKSPLSHHDVFVGGDESTNGFYGQRCHWSAEDVSEDLLNRDFAGIKFGLVSWNFNPKRSGYDASTEDRLESFVTPRLPLVLSLKLKPSSARSRLFVTDSGEPFFIDLRGNQDGQTCVRGDILGEFLAKFDLVPVWRCYIEKDGGEGGMSYSGGDFKRSSYVGLYWLEGGKWKGEIAPDPRS